MKFSNVSRVLCSVSVLLALQACQTRAYPPLLRAQSVEIPRFMGDWYVIGCIPSIIERHDYNAVESYHLDPAGRILTVFTFNEGSFDGPLKHYKPVGFVTPGTHGTIWGMRFVWPIKADYRVMYVKADYSETVIGRERRDYAWIMARSASIPDADYQRLRTLLSSQGYDITRLRKVPQRPPGAAER
ncbi:MAG TPA: lipocalin family protein [Steroidobacteraceae bacterium]|jgi:apolipoprotein D and lipocalin family protein|nr:lipocalin family protein [Steroidobacteraceae bacterium]